MHADLILCTPQVNQSSIWNVSLWIPSTSPVKTINTILICDGGVFSYNCSARDKKSSGLLENVTLEIEFWKP